MASLTSSNSCITFDTEQAVKFNSLYTSLKPRESFCSDVHESLPRDPSCDEDNCPQKISAGKFPHGAESSIITSRKTSELVVLAALEDVRERAVENIEDFAASKEVSESFCCGGLFGVCVVFSLLSIFWRTSRRYLIALCISSK